MNRDSYFQHLFFDRIYIAKKLGLNTDFLLKYWESTKITNSIQEVIEICNIFNISIDEYFDNEIEIKNNNEKFNTKQTIDIFDPVVLGNNIKNFRLDEHMSTADLAEKAGYSERLIQYFEAGERTPHINTLVDIAIALNVPMSYLLSK